MRKCTFELTCTERYSETRALILLRFISLSVVDIITYFYFLNCYPPGRHFNFVCTGMCGHTIGKLAHPQTKAGPLTNKKGPIPRLCTIKHEPKLAKLQQVLSNFT